MSGANGDDGRRPRGPRPDATFGELPPPIEVTSLFDDDARGPAPTTNAAISAAMLSMTGRDDVEVFAPLPRAGDRRTRTAPAAEGWDGVERRRARPADTAAARTTPLPAVRAPKPAQALPAPKSAPTNAPPRRAGPARTTEAKPDRALWPSLEKQQRQRAQRQARARKGRTRVDQGRKALTTIAGGVRTVRRVRRVTTLAALAPMLGWLVVPLLLLLLVLLASRGGDDRADSGTTSSTTSVTTVAQAPSAPGAGSTPSAGASTSAATPAPSGRVSLSIRLEDTNGVARSVAAVVLVGDRTVTGTTTRLPLQTSAEAAPGDQLTLLVPQPPNGSHLLCVVTADGAVTGAMTREQSEGMLDCSTKVADLASGGT